MHILYLQRKLHFRGRNNILAVVVTSKGTFKVPTSCSAFQSLYGLHPFGHGGRQCEMHFRHECTVGSLNLYTLLFFVYGGLAMD